MKKEEAERLQGVRKPRKDEEMAWALPRNKSDWPGWREATKMEEYELEPEGEAEVPEIIIVSDAVEGTFMDLDGRRKVVRVESEEAQDYVREAKSTEYEEEEERTFVPNA